MVASCFSFLGNFLSHAFRITDGKPMAESRFKKSIQVEAKLDNANICREMPHLRYGSYATERPTISHSTPFHSIPQQSKSTKMPQRHHQADVDDASNHSAIKDILWRGRLVTSRI